jgi:hypothetical protein
MSNPILTAAVLAAKRASLDNMQSTIPITAGTQTTHSRTFQVDTPQPLPAYPAAGAAAKTILSYQVPASMSGSMTSICIVHIGASGSFTDGSGVVVWRVLLNGAPVKGLENIYVQIGSQTQLATMYLLLHENDLLTITAQIPTGQTAPVGNPFSRIAGYLDYGGLGSQAPAKSAAAAQAATTTTTTFTAPSGVGSGGVGSRTGSSGGSGNRTTQASMN